MRLFVAIQFSPEVKKTLLDAIASLRRQAAAGSFTRPENLHLTLAFIGESDRVGDIEAVMDDLRAQSFSISVGGFGRFGDLYWAGIEKSDKLSSLARELQESLMQQGFDIEKREFKPHITLARQVESKEPPRLSIPQTAMAVTRLSLMKSERINGRLTYTEIYGRTLQ